VRFVEDDQSVMYYATYTAYNGHTTLPQLIETEDFLHFRILILNGSTVQNKGMALFPRRIDGRYAMLSQQDDENLFASSAKSVGGIRCLSAAKRQESLESCPQPAASRMGR
jgi:predicted GH43/DUF377 family glycosyl hydrolase